LEVEAAAAKGTCQQFKEQADRLREEMRVAAEKERAMFHEKRELIERLHLQGKVDGGVGEEDTGACGEIGEIKSVEESGDYRAELNV
jgi:hypothetical protein